MCGICGIYEYKHRAPIDPRTLKQMLASIRHRGPDDEGAHLEPGIALGSRRLSIIDLVGGNQPIYNEDGSVVVVFNGEIYNYAELAAGLRQRGHALATASDTEVIVHLYEERGADCVCALRGMFAFALWDARTQQLLLARDHLGVKPLYYCVSDGRLLFGSEIKAILQHSQIQAQLNLNALNNYLSLKYVPAPQTMFENIFALPPGHRLTCDGRGVRVQQYWDVGFADSVKGQKREEDYAEELAALLQESVRMQLMSDVPFGAFLSGGLDSSTVVALMSQFLNEPVKTFSVGYEGEGARYSELPFARMVAERYHTQHHEILIRPEHLMQLADKVAWHLDQPIADDAVLANYMVAELASRHVKMVLTGEGGDELFAGYARYAGEQFSQWFNPLPKSGKQIMLAASRKIPGLRRPKLALNALMHADPVARMANWFVLFDAERKARLLHPHVQAALNGHSHEQIFAEQLARASSTTPLNRMLYVDTKLWLPDDLLARGDKMSMAASLEARVPLLDHKLVEFAAQLPANLKLRGLTRKYLLKKVARQWLPAPILSRKKQGFPVPYALWFRNEARPFVRDVLSSDTVRRRGLLQPQFVEQLLNEHESGFADHSSQLWGLINLELWQRHYLDVPQAQSVNAQDRSSETRNAS